MINWATAIRMKCLKIPTAIFRNRARVRSTAEKVTRASLLVAYFLSALAGVAAAASSTFHVRLSPGPRLVGTRADRSGGGSVTATLEGNSLTLQGSFSGLLDVPTGAHLHMSSLPGVRGPSIAELSVSQATTGALSGTVQLNPQQLAALPKGGLYIEIDSEKAPEGDLWGWIMP
jgi:CHRD domain